MVFVAKNVYHFIGKKSFSFFQNFQVVKWMATSHGPRRMVIEGSRYSWKKTKDLIYFYAFIGMAPLTLITLYANVFIGPATLTETPEGYEPKHWEYEKSPISRFIQKYMMTDPQLIYERNLHYYYEHQEQLMLRDLEKKVKALMAERGDYQAWYYKPHTAKYIRSIRKNYDDVMSYSGGYDCKDDD